MSSRAEGRYVSRRGVCRLTLLRNRNSNREKDRWRNHKRMKEEKEGEKRSEMA